ncbi:MAG: hypothetical protein U0802_04040 [Candidatus Binatia bacterium]
MLLLRRPPPRNALTTPVRACAPTRLAACARWAALYPPTGLIALDRAEQARRHVRIVRDFTGVGAEPDAAARRWRDASPIEQVHAGIRPRSSCRAPATCSSPSRRPTLAPSTARAAGAAYPPGDRRGRPALRPPRCPTRAAWR